MGKGTEKKHVRGGREENGKASRVSDLFDPILMTDHPLPTTWFSH